MKRSERAVLFAIFLLAMAVSLVHVPPTVAGGKYVENPKVKLLTKQSGAFDYTDQLIVKFRDPGLVVQNKTNTLARMTRLSGKAGVSLSLYRAMSGDAHVLKLPQRMSIDEVAAIAEKVSGDPDVLYAEPDGMMRPMLAPNDPRYIDQWHYSDTWGANLPGAWDITTGSADVVVAVIDTGILPLHGDIAGRTVAGYDFISDPFVANDGHGRDADPSDPGDWTLANECFAGSPAQDSSWHGTHVAGTIGAATDNNIGVAGINWAAKILPVRVLGKCGGFISDIADGMRWAAGLSVPGIGDNTNPAQVLNLSLGGSGACGTTYQNAINNIVAAGSVVVVAAGNSNENASLHRPGNCNGVITVAATNRDGGKASYSNFGSVVEIAAPGGETFPTSANGVLSTLNDGATSPGSDDYVFYQGTSMAAPHVAGIVSLMLSADASLTPAEVLQRLEDSAQSFPAGTPGTDCTTNTCGAGIIDAAAAVSGLCCKNPNLQAPIVQQNQVTYQWSCNNEWTWFYVWVQDRNTGELHHSGWVESSDSSWSQTLPQGYDRAWVRVWDDQCDYSAWSNPQDFAVDCAQVDLKSVADQEDQPTYDWSGSSGEWTWFSVEVNNLTTGETYNSGWIQSSASTWTQPAPLPWGTYQARVRVWHDQCGNSEWSAPVEWTVGNCPDKPVLQSVSGDQPTYDWSGTPGEWTWFYVYVQNTSTGETYNSGWISSSASTWTQTEPLPWGPYKVWVRVWHDQCGNSEWSAPEEWTVGNCPGKPVLQSVSGDQPTYDWSGTSGEWTWFYVWVQNISTGEKYSSGWISSSASTWTQPAPLPQGVYKAWVQLWHPECGNSEWSAPEEWAVGTTSVRFYNNLGCAGQSFTATLTVCGVTFTASTGTWSSCKTVTAGTCTASIFANTLLCGTIDETYTVDLDPDCIYDTELTLIQGVPDVDYDQTCPGDCTTPEPWTLDAEKGLLIDISPAGEGFTQHGSKKAVRGTENGEN